MREYIAYLFYFTGLTWLFFFLSRLYYGKEHIRVINYHATPRLFEQNFEKQLRFFKKYYTDTNEKELLNFLSSKNWLKDKPGLIISFDDGLKNNKEVALPLLEKYGFTGWLCIPPEFAKEHNTISIKKDSPLKMYGKIFTANESVTMSDLEINEAAQNHEIVCHTDTHKRLSAEVTDEAILKQELIDSKSKLEQIISRKVNGFCWVGGELENYSLKAHNIIKSNYEYSFQTNNLPILKKTNRFFIDRSNIEAWFSFPFFLLTISGFYDFIYRNKRAIIKNALNKH